MQSPCKLRQSQHEVRKKLHEAVKRVVVGESKVSGAPRDPEIAISRRAPLTSNDPETVKSLEKEFKQYFGNSLGEGEPGRPCEDFSILATSQCKPYAYWFFGTVDPEKWNEAERKGRLGLDIPQNHSPFNAPAIQPTLETGVDALSLAALTFLT